MGSQWGGASKVKAKGWAVLPSPAFLVQLKLAWLEIRLMPLSMTAAELMPDWIATRQRLVRYGVVLAMSAGLHFLVWHHRDLLAHRPEPKLKPVQTIEVMLTPVPPPMPAEEAPKGPEPGKEKAEIKEVKRPEPKKAKPKAADAAKTPQIKAESKPKALPKPQPAVEPKPIALPKPRPRPVPEAKPEEPRPVPKLEAEPRPEPRPHPRPRPSEEPDPNIVEPRPEPSPRRSVERPAHPAERPARVRTEEGAATRHAAEAVSPGRTERPAEGGASAARHRAGESGHSGGSRGEAEEGPSRPAGYLHNPRPAYPTIAKSREWEGRVVVRVRVLADGSCGHAEVSSSSGHDVLDEAARNSVCSSWRFRPALKGGKAVESTVNVPINFKLE